MLLVDDETRTYWDHITGEAVYGPLTGRKLANWGVGMTNARAAAKRFPQLRVYDSRPGRKERLMSWAFSRFLKGRFPPGFRSTMGEQDPRLPAMEIGLGVVEGEARRFYPLSAIGDGIDGPFAGRDLRVRIGAADRVPSAEYEDGSRPLQLFSRWYGFSSTFPGCEVYGERRGEA